MKLRAFRLGAACFVGGLCSAARVDAATSDPWLGPDKTLHFGVSTLIASGGYASSVIWLHEPWQRAAAGGTLAVAAGVGKELYDLSGRGDPSWKDLTWDVLGAALGVSIALCVDAALRGHSAPTAARSALAVSF